MENHKGKSMDEAIEDHAAHEINFTVPALEAAGKAMGLQGHFKKASVAKKGYEKEMARVLPASSEFALGQQKSDLSGEDLAKINYKCARNGSDGRAAGYKRGALGTTVNKRKEEVDAARSRATAAIHANGSLPGFDNSKRVKNFPTALSRPRQGQVLP